MTGKNLYEFGLDATNPHSIRIKPEIFPETNYSMKELTNFLEDNESLLIKTEMITYSAILKAIDHGNEGIIFLCLCRYRKKISYTLTPS